MRYQIDQKIINVEIVSINDFRIKNNASPIKSRSLLQLIQFGNFTQILFTNTLPDVFVTLQRGQTLADTYFMSYRAFLGFASNFAIIPVEKSVSWAKHGF